MKHEWEDVYIHGGHYPDARRCSICGEFDVSTTSKTCGETPAEQLLEDYDRERAASYRLAGHHTGHGMGKIASHSERLAQAQRVKAARTKLLTALNTRATPPAPAGLDLRGIAFAAIQRARKAGESEEMLARWISEDIRATLTANGSQSDRPTVPILVGQEWLDRNVATDPNAEVEARGSQPDRVVDVLREQIINSPETADFMAGVPLEAAHQRDRWGADHDAGKQPLDWFWLIGYLAQKAATSAMDGDTEKALHHTISTAAALANWHAALSGKSNAMRPGIDSSTLDANSPSNSKENNDV